MFVLDVNEDVVKMFSDAETFTGYEIAKRMNLRPQMIYNYIQKDFIKHIVKNDQNVVEQNEAIRWCSKYLAKKNSK